MTADEAIREMRDTADARWVGTRKGTAHAPQIARWADAVEAEIERLKNELADALDVRRGNGPTALSMVVADNKRLRHAVELGAKQKLPDEADDEDREFADYEHGYTALVKLCRAALADTEKEPKP